MTTNNLSITADSTIEALFTELYVPRRLIEAKPKTIHQHDVARRHLGRYLGREPLVSDLNEQTMLGFIRWLSSEDTKRAAITINKSVDKLRALWTFAARRRILPDFPELPKLKEPRRLPKGWTLTEFEAMLAACRQMYGRIEGVQAKLWWRALLLLLYYTGARIGAAMQLEWEDIDLDAGHVLFRAETQKQFADQRFRLPADAVAALRDIAQPRRQIVFPWVYTNTMLYYRLRYLLKAAGLPADRRSKFHKIRRTSASLLKSVGGDPTQHLGHSSPKVTAGYLDQSIAGDGSQCHLLPTPQDGPARDNASDDDGSIMRFFWCAYAPGQMQAETGCSPFEATVAEQLSLLVESWDDVTDDVLEQLAGHFRSTGRTPEATRNYVSMARRMRNAWNEYKDAQAGYPGIDKLSERVFAGLQRTEGGAA